MPVYSLDGDTSGLPKTIRGGIPYEIEALSPREVWGAGSGTTTLVCRVGWEESVDWIKAMVGEVQVSSTSSSMSLRRHVPEVLQYNLAGDGSDSRVQFCTSVEQIDQHGNADGGRFAQAVTNWPKADYCRYRVTWEALPYAILDYSAPIGSLPSIADIITATGSYAGAPELNRYVIRKRRSYTREQPTPGPNAVANFGFYVVDDVDSSKRKLLPGAVMFRNVQYADITLRWVRVPVGWCPPVSYAPASGWPPRFNPSGVDPTTVKRTRDTFQGTVNSTWFDCAAADGLCCPPETLLYTGYSDDQKYYDAAGDWVCDIDFFFKFKGGADADGNIRGWNHYLNSSGKWVAVTAGTAPPGGTAGTSSGTAPYKTNDFNDLFRYKA